MNLQKVGTFLGIYLLIATTLILGGYRFGGKWLISKDYGRMDAAAIEKLSVEEQVERARFLLSSAKSKTEFDQTLKKIGAETGPMSLDEWNYHSHLMGDLLNELEPQRAKLPGV